MLNSDGNWFIYCVKNVYYNSVIFVIILKVPLIRESHPGFISGGSESAECRSILIYRVLCELTFQIIFLLRL